MSYSSVVMSHMNGNHLSTAAGYRHCPATHTKCLNANYPRTKIQRLPVADHQVSWDSKYVRYEPVVFIDESAKGKPWSDPDYR